MTTRCTLREKLAHGDAQGDDQGCDTQRLVSQTMGRPFVAEGGFGLERKPREVLAMWDSPPLPSPHKAVDKQQQPVQDLRDFDFSKLILIRELRLIH